MKIQLKESKKSTAKKVESKQDISENQESEEIANIYDKLVQIKNEAEKESAQFDLERAEMQMVIHKL